MSITIFGFHSTAAAGGADAARREREGREARAASAAVGVRAVTVPLAREGWAAVPPHQIYVGDSEGDLVKSIHGPNLPPDGGVMRVVKQLSQEEKEERGRSYRRAERNVACRAAAREGRKHPGENRVAFVPTAGARGSSAGLLPLVLPKLARVEPGACSPAYRAPLASIITAAAIAASAFISRAVSGAIRAPLAMTAVTRLGRRRRPESFSSALPFEMNAARRSFQRKQDDEDDEHDVDEGDEVYKDGDDDDEDEDYDDDEDYEDNYSDEDDDDDDDDDDEGNDDHQDDNDDKDDEDKDDADEDDDDDDEGDDVEDGDDDDEDGDDDDEDNDEDDEDEEHDDDDDQDDDDDEDGDKDDDDDGGENDKNDETPPRCNLNRRYRIAWQEDRGVPAP
ncbi:unnamed protein product [Lampetra planeri]